MNKFKYSESENKLLLVIPEPIGCPENPPCFNCLKQLAEYNSRLSYSLSKELKDKLIDGQVLNENEFALKNVRMARGLGYYKIAIPLPEQKYEIDLKGEGDYQQCDKKEYDKFPGYKRIVGEQTNKVKEPEKLFNLDEALQIWDAAHLRGFQFEQYSGKTEAELPTAFNKEDYFSKTFGIDIKNNQPSNT